MKISKTSKLNARSWSLQAVETCPGSRGADGQLVPACSGCYATTGCYNFSTTKAPREHNKQDWQRPEWVADMIEALKKDKLFRWFDSGDAYHVDLAEKIYQVMKGTPNTKHWLPTRMAKFSKFQPVLEKMQKLENVMVRFSSDSITGEFSEKHGSVIIPDAESAPKGVTVCQAYTRGGKCSDCSACWDKGVSVIGYPQHGKKMAKVFKLALVA
jgi:hypothetical protein